MIRSFIILLTITSLTLAAAAQQINIPSDGSDGVFNPPSSIEIDLSLATTASWDTPGNGNGIYDPDQWGVVFKFESINIPSGVTVTFKNHPSRAPVIWLVQGDVTINGTVNLDGAQGHNSGQLRTFSEPGAGGFRGGRGSTANTNPAGGLGPGGGMASASPASGGGGGYATNGGSGQAGGGGPYGNPGLFPLIGGSGGGGSNNGNGAHGGGAGGGAIVIGSSSEIVLNGAIRANGGAGSGGGSGHRGSGGGSGGAIRLIAHGLSGSGTLRATGGSGGGGWSGDGGNGSLGRIRVEAFENFLDDLGDPAYSFGVPASEPRIFRDAETPTVRAATLAGIEVPLDPQSKLAFPTMDVQLDEGGEQTLLIQAENMPPSGTMVVRLVRRSGAPLTFPATFVSGDPFLSTWQAEVDLPQGFSAIQIRAVLPDR